MIFDNVLLYNKKNHEQWIFLSDTSNKWTCAHVHTE